jgi:hypothetical protein
MAPARRRWAETGFITPADLVTSLRKPNLTTVQARFATDATQVGSR